MLGVLQGVLHASSESHCCFGGEKKREKDVSFLGCFLGEHGYVVGFFLLLLLTLVPA